MPFTHFNTNIFGFRVILPNFVAERAHIAHPNVVFFTLSANNHHFTSEVSESRIFFTRMTTNA